MTAANVSTASVKAVLNSASHVCSSAARRWQKRRTQSVAAFSMASADADRVPLPELQFEHTALSCLPVDENPDREIKASVPGVCFSLVDAQSLDSPEVVCVSESALALLGAKVDEQDAVTPQLLSLSATFSNCRTYAHCYCGHQFGSFAGQLGDGAATSIGEVNTADNGRWELQFKGAGQTPYSRAGDGRKVLRSSVREFLASEAMHHLGIPTTRAASVCTSQTTVLRDPFYSGSPIQEPCAVVLRLAPSFLRFGSLEIVRSSSNTGRKGPSHETPQLLNSILDYLIFYHFRGIWDMSGGGGGLQEPPPSPAQKRGIYVALYEEVAERTLRLCAQWQGVGFCHGVLNTDNMSLLGLTIDYGPYGWLDRYDEQHICNSSDDGGRYAYGRQPWAVQENLKLLGDLIALAGGDSHEVARIHGACADKYTAHFHAVMRRKLGLQLPNDDDDDVIQELQACMQQSGADFTITFRKLAVVRAAAATVAAATAAAAEASPADNTGAAAAPAAAAAESNNNNNSNNDGGVREFLEAVMATCPDPGTMAEGVRSAIDPRQLALLQKLASEQPAMLARLGLSSEEVAGEVRKNEEAARLAAQSPYEKKQRDEDAWRAWLARYQQRLQQELAGGRTQEEREALMNASNPKIVLRNWVAQVAIDAAAKGDYASVKRILRLLERPFREWPEEEMMLDVGGLQWAAGQPPPAPLKGLCVSCSS